MSPGTCARPAPVDVYIGLGSNLECPERQVASAIRTLSALPNSKLLASSRLYRTAPVGLTDQPDYINAVVRLETRLEPRALLDALQAIERAHGRRRDGTRWGPRTLDLDILLYGDERLDTPGLTIPHPELANRAFVLVPLSEIAPADLQVPGLGDLAALAARRGRDGVEPCNCLDDATTA